MSDADLKLPGVTLRHRGSRRFQVGTKHKAEMTLECEIEDEVVWEEVEKMLLAPAGFRIYTQEDFKGEMLNVFREEVRQLEAENAALRSENKRVQAQNAAMETQLQEYKDVFDGFNKQFHGR